MSGQSPWGPLWLVSAGTAGALAVGHCSLDTCSRLGRGAGPRQAPDARPRPQGRGVRRL